MPTSFTDAIRREYEQLFTACTVRPEWKGQVEHDVTTVLRGRARYASVGDPLRIPWFFIGIIHVLECGGSFERHLHNGNPLRAKTVDVPAGRPLEWPPNPWPLNAWEISATDALTFKGLHKWRDWTIAGLCWRWESNNGFGSRNRGVRTAYLWSGSYHDTDGDGVVDPGELIYEKGKYIRDHVWDPNAVSKQIGAAVILRRMVDQHLVDVALAATDPKCTGVK